MCPVSHWHGDLFPVPSFTKYKVEVYRVFRPILFTKNVSGACSLLLESPDGTTPVDNFGIVVGENPIPYGILALWDVNGLSMRSSAKDSNMVRCENHYTMPA